MCPVRYRIIMPEQFQLIDLISVRFRMHLVWNYVFGNNNKKKQKRGINCRWGGRDKQHCGINWKQCCRCATWKCIRGTASHECYSARDTSAQRTRAFPIVENSLLIQHSKWPWCDYSAVSTAHTHSQTIAMTPVGKCNCECFALSFNCYWISIAACAMKTFSSAGPQSVCLLYKNKSMTS